MTNPLDYSDGFGLNRNSIHEIGFSFLGTYPKTKPKIKIEDKIKGFPYHNLPKWSVSKELENIEKSSKMTKIKTNLS